jgi:hypothetical protein
VVVVPDELVPEEHHLPLQQCGADFGDVRVAQRCGEIDAVDLGAGPAGLGPDVERLGYLCHS